MSREATIAVNCSRRRLLTKRSFKRTRVLPFSAFDDDDDDDDGSAVRRSFSASNELIVANACGSGRLVAVAHSLTVTSAVSLNSAKTPV